MSSCERNFLGWGPAPIARAAGALCESLSRRSESLRALDLRHVLVVLPGARAGRLLRRSLATIAAARTLELLPPTITTPGVMMGLILPRVHEGLVAASPAQQLMSWLAGLARMSAEDRSLIAARDDGVRAANVARRLQRTRDVLCGGLVTLEEAAARAIEDGQRDAARWEALLRLEQSRLAWLGERGMFDPRAVWTSLLKASEVPPPPDDLWEGIDTIEPTGRVGGAFAGTGTQRALFEDSRREEPHEGAGVGGSGNGAAAVPSRDTASIESCGFDRIVLIGVSELTRAATSALNRCNALVHAFVLAPESERERFDPWGCVRAGAWEDVTPPVANRAIRIVESAESQADEALDVLAELAPTHARDEVVLCVPDRGLAPLIERRARRAGLAVHDSAGVPMTRSAPVRALLLLLELVEHGSFDAFAAFVRHPDVERAVATRLGATAGFASEFWLGALDDFHRSTLPESADDVARGGDVLRELHDAVRAVLGDLSWERAQRERTPSEWAAVLASLMRTLYANAVPGFDPERESDRSRTHAAIDTIGGGLRDMRSGSDDGPVLTSAGAIRLLLALVHGATLPDNDDPGSIEMLGWLEAALDDSRAAIVGGMNEGVLPARTPRDALISGVLARSLGLDDAPRRFARDCYLLTLLAHSKTSLTLLAARRDVRGDALMPSRLLFLCDEQDLVARAGLWAHGGARWVEPAGSAAPTRTMLPVMPRDARQRPAPEALRITAFRDYLRSPYLFYLRHVLELEEEADNAAELDARRFGELVHECLSAFARDDRVRDARDERDIRAFLDGALDATLRRWFGRESPALAWVQGEQARMRLHAFAAWQAAQACAGWRIAHAEWSPAPGSIEWNVDGTPIRLSGRIDRIDVHETLGVRVIDFKTSERAITPTDAHREGGRWVDLQLPLYSLLSREVVSTLETRGPLTLAYVVIPADARVELRAAAWTDHELAEALDTAREVVRKVRDGAFFELGTEPPERGVFGALAGAGIDDDGEPRDAEEGAEEAA